MDWLFTATYLVVLSLKNRGMAFKVKLTLRHACNNSYV